MNPPSINFKTLNNIERTIRANEDNMRSIPPRVNLNIVNDGRRNSLNSGNENLSDDELGMDILANPKRTRPKSTNSNVDFSERPAFNFDLYSKTVNTSLPHVKIFFKCSLKVAAKRRFKEFKKTNNKITLKNIEKAIRQRNLVDSTRKFSPLRIPRGAVIVDTTNMNKKQMFRRIFKIVEG